MILIPQNPWQRSMYARVLIAALIFFIWAVSEVSAADQSQERSVIGSWKLTSVLDFSEISALDDREAKRFVGKLLNIRANKVQLGSRVCSAPTLNAERVEPRLDLESKAHASAANLRLPNPVTVVELSCAYVYIRDKNHIVLAWMGAFFDAVRVNR